MSVSSLLSIHSSIIFLFPVLFSLPLMPSSQLFILPLFPSSRLTTLPNIHSMNFQLYSPLRTLMSLIITLCTSFLGYFSSSINLNFTIIIFTDSPACLTLIAQSRPYQSLFIRCTFCYPRLNNLIFNRYIHYLLFIWPSTSLYASPLYDVTPSVIVCCS